MIMTTAGNHLAIAMDVQLLEAQDISQSHKEDIERAFYQQLKEYIDLNWDEIISEYIVYQHWHEIIWNEAGKDFNKEFFAHFVEKTNSWVRQKETILGELQSIVASSVFKQSPFAWVLSKIEADIAYEVKDESKTGHATKILLMIISQQDTFLRYWMHCQEEQLPHSKRKIRKLAHKMISGSKNSLFSQVDREETAIKVPVIQSKIPEKNREFYSQIRDIADLEFNWKQHYDKRPETGEQGDKGQKEKKEQRVQKTEKAKTVNKEINPSLDGLLLGLENYK